jgi:DNA replication and repair protein RecF
VTVAALHRAPAPAAPMARHAGPGCALALRQLDLTDFRNYVALRLELAPRPVVLTGPNGAGKTNLLEAVSYLGPGRGLRRAALPAVARHGSAGGRWAVAARLVTPAGPVRLGTGISEAPGRRRAIHVDGEAARGQMALAEHVNVIWLTPEMDRLFQDGAAGRRRFLDRMVYGFDPEHASRVAAYEQAVRGRARLLRDGVADAAWLAAQEDVIADKGVAIAAARRDAVARLAAAIAEDAEAASALPFPRAGLALDGEVEGWLGDGPALAAEDRLRAALAASRRDDAASGTTAHGPHRSDLRVRHLGKDRPADQCSTGEQKALLIGIVLAHARLQALARGAPPVLLLDEVAAHLDADRRAALYDRLVQLGAQAWLTGTDAALFEAIAPNAQFFAVDNATVSPAGAA